jgi:hypothetical protein
LNTPGAIDADYRGEVKVVVVDLGQEDFAVESALRNCPAGDRARFSRVAWPAGPGIAIQRAVGRGLWLQAGAHVQAAGPWLTPAFRGRIYDCVLDTIWATTAGNGCPRLTEKFGVKAELLWPSWNSLNLLSSVTVRMGLAID